MIIPKATTIVKIDPDIYLVEVEDCKDRYMTLNIKIHRTLKLILSEKDKFNDN